MKQINISYYNNNNIKVLTFKIITTITVKTIKIIKLPREKKTQKNNIKATKIIFMNIIVLIMKKNRNK